MTTKSRNNVPPIPLNRMYLGFVRADRPHAPLPLSPCDMDVPSFYDETGRSTVTHEQLSREETSTHRSLYSKVRLCSSVLAHLGCPQSLSAVPSPALLCGAGFHQYLGCPHRDIDGHKHHEAGISLVKVYASTKPPAYRKTSTRLRTYQKEQAND